jgi:hypothetical protein
LEWLLFPACLNYKKSSLKGITFELFACQLY